MRYTKNPAFWALYLQNKRQRRLSTNSIAIQGAGKIAPLLNAIKNASTSRAVIGWHGMSITAGVGSDGISGGTFTSAWRTSSIPAKLAELLTAQVGGSQSLGAECVAIQSVGNAFYTLGNSAALSGAYNAAGASGTVCVLTGGTTQNIGFSVNNRAGQVVRVYAYVTGVSAGVTPRYILSGANTQAITALPASVADNVLPTGSAWWYTTDIVLANAGTTTVQIVGSATAGHNVSVFAINPDHRTDAGITMHRLSYSGKGLGDMLAMSLDNTDTQPAGNWIGSGNANRRQTQFDSLTTQLGLQGAILSFDVNDIQHFSSYGYTLAAHQRHIANIVAAYAAKSLPVLMVLGLSLRNPTSVSGSPGYTQADIIDAYKAAADASTNCAYIDLRGNWSGFTFAEKYAAQIADTNNWIASEAPNYLHPAAPGHAMYASLISGSISKALAG